MRCARKTPCWPATGRGEGAVDEVMRNSRKAPDPSLWQCPPYPPPHTHLCGGRQWSRLHEETAVTEGQHVARSDDAHEGVNGQLGGGGAAFLEGSLRVCSGVGGGHAYDSHEGGDGQLGRDRAALLEVGLCAMQYTSKGYLFVKISTQDLPGSRRNTPGSARMISAPPPPLYIYPTCSGICATRVCTRGREALPADQMHSP